ncbi:4'-phosphopantetheinyl transferase family protein [Alteromonas sp. ASW11-130]|uniref:4'-phosphopantetheinyl transferase family protein n=1 Tax=Alteromonas sp. ASW11-130 TaxID=3015775 RepID=UPI0022419C33|nr:4'-phosphopantetheinyl transferase superfamily protein [Alteromonas sp. ASW11-130]MCW8090248.1 4'-phosphopantetheinyl transferase superfamily protein [Alteromonas sp. ASW11-130]
MKNLVGLPGVCYQSNFEIDNYTDMLYQELLNANLHKTISNAVKKRKSEFLAGRYLAKLALQSLGSDDTFVCVGKNRAPIWPKGFIGSISHTDDTAICAMAKRNEVSRLGLDIETVLPQSVAKEIIKSVLITSEFALAGSVTEPDTQMTTLIFSAKESLFKALYSEVGYYFGFENAEVKVVNTRTGKFVIELTSQLTPSLPGGTRFEGLFEILGNKVLTVIATP